MKKKWQYCRKFFVFLCVLPLFPYICEEKVAILPEILHKNMIKIHRNRYLQQLIDGRENGFIKIVTGIRRCGKSYLLFRLFYEHLLREGVANDHIIRIALDDIENAKLREPLTLYRHIKDLMVDADLYYILLDEILLVPRFEELLNILLRLENADVYVTGSNSRFLSSDIITEFRGRGDEIHLYPLSFSEFCQDWKDTLSEAWKEYYTFGGLPHILSLTGEQKKVDYLSRLFESVYLKDILERHRVKNQSELAELTRIIASSIGAPCNPNKLANTFKSNKGITISSNTIDRYLSYLQDSFLIERSVRYDIKGKRYINNLSKYYFSDLGLRNAMLGMRQQEENHIMENIIYNELRMRGCKVDVGIVEHRTINKEGVWQRKQLEVDFVVNRGSRRYYIQSALALPTEEKRAQESASLLRVNDSFKKLIIVRDDVRISHDENGITTIGLFDFLLHENLLDGWMD